MNSTRSENGPIQNPNRALWEQVDDFETHAAKPDEREEDDVEIIWTYNDARKFPGFFFDAEFTPKGELTGLLLSSTGS